MVKKKDLRVSLKTKLKKVFVMGDKSLETKMEDEKESFQAESEGKYQYFFSSSSLAINIVT